MSKAAKEIMYARQRLFEFQDKPNKMLANLLPEQKDRSKLPNFLQTSRGDLVKPETEKFAVFGNSYETLYTSLDSNRIKIDEFLSSLEIPQIAQNHKLILVAPITPFEIDQAISKLKPNRSPGLDGLTSEFYRSYRDIVSPYLKDLFDYCLQNKGTPASWKEARLTLILKPGKK